MRVLKALFWVSLVYGIPLVALAGWIWFAAAAFWIRTEAGLDGLGRSTCPMPSWWRWTFGEHRVWAGWLWFAVDLVAINVGGLILGMLHGFQRVMVSAVLRGTTDVPPSN